MGEAGTGLPSVQAVQGVILETLDALHTRFVTGKGVPEIRDDQNAPNLTMGCEVMESFLVPALYGGMQNQVRDILSFADARELMSSIIATYRDSGYDKEAFKAGSYLADPEGGTAEEAQVVDAASFCLTACLHFRAFYREDVESDGELDWATSEIIDEALSFLWASRAEETDPTTKLPRPTGWNWGQLGKRYAYRYFTYVALDGVLDYLCWAESDPADWILGEAGAAQVKKYRRFVNDLATSILTYLDDASLSKGMLKLPDDVTGVLQSSWYYNLWTIYSLLMMWEVGSSIGVADDERAERLGRAIELLAQRYVPNPSKPEFEKDFQFNLAKVVSDTEVHGVGVWMDRGFAPLILKSYASYVPLLAARTDTSDDNATQMYRALMARRLPTKEWDTLGGFSVYYTERAVEALVKLLDYLAMDPPQAGAAQPLGDLQTLTIRIAPEELRAVMGSNTQMSPLGGQEAFFAVVDDAFCAMEDELAESNVLTSARELIDSMREAGADALKVFAVQLGAMMTGAENFKRNYPAPKRRPTK